MLAYLTESFSKNFRYLEPNIPVMGVIGACGFPLYYYIWAHLFPQPYESLMLRAIGFTLSIGLIFFKQWPEPFKRLQLAYVYFTLLYALPFFFTYMLLANEGNSVWLLSTMAALVLMVMLLDWFSLILHFVVGSLIAVLTFSWINDAWAVPAAYWEHAPVYLFVIVTTGALSFTREMVKQEKQAVSFSIGASIAHELRNPLLSLRLSVQGLRRQLARRAARATTRSAKSPEGGPGNTGGDERVLRQLDAMEQQIVSAFTVIDILLVKVGVEHPMGDEDGNHSVVEVIDNAVDTFPYKASNDRSMVSWNGGEEFRFEGNRLMVMHVLYNLIKNAIHYVAKADREEGGRIEIFTSTGEDGNRIHVRDNGIGIERDKIGRVFEWFYSATDSPSAAGVGLPFCRMVMEKLGGEIRVLSGPGEYTEFILSFPPVEDGAESGG